MTAYYNEIDPFAAAWLRELIKAGLIADGEVDERSIELVQPDDVRGFTQCHFFAGIGGWSLALRLAGWDDARACWTGSCPCQPFSSAGAQTGGHDPRDLWPIWFQLVKECRPPVVFGEQVEAAIGHGWLDRLCDDLEAEDYAVGACGLPGPCVGAYDIRQRLWFVADTPNPEWRAGERRRGLAGDGATDIMADTEYTQRRPLRGPIQDERDGDDARREEAHGEPGACGAVRLLADACGERRQQDAGRASGDENQNGRQPDGDHVAAGDGAAFWADADWIPCTDGKARPIEPGSFPLAARVSGDVGRLRGYGNSIKPQVAQVFIEAYLEGEAG